MKNSYRNFVVNGTSALKCDAASERKSARIVAFPGNYHCNDTNVTKLRTQRDRKAVDNKARIDIILAFVISCAISYGTIFSMI